MGIVIEDPVIVERIHMLSVESGKTAEDVVAQAIDAQFPHTSSGPLSGRRREAAMFALREAQVFFRTNRDPNDTRTSDEIVGYDEDGLPN